jgi:hypothetical protein
MGKPESISSVIRNKAMCLFSPLLFNIVLEILDKARERNKIHMKREGRSQIVPVFR